MRRGDVFGARFRLSDWAETLFQGGRRSCVAACGGPLVPGSHQPQITRSGHLSLDASIWPTKSSRRQQKFMPDRKIARRSVRCALFPHARAPAILL